MVAPVFLRRAMFSAVMHDPPWPGVRAHVVLLRGIHLLHSALAVPLSSADIVLHPPGQSEPVGESGSEVLDTDSKSTDPHDVEDPDQLRILVEVEAQDAAARPEHGLTEARIVSRRPDHRIPGLRWLTPQHSRRAHHAHAQAASGTEPGPRRRTRPGNSPRRPAARPAGNHLLSRRATGRPAMTGGRQSLLIPRTGVSDGPQPPQSQQLLQADGTAPDAAPLPRRLCTQPGTAHGSPQAARRGSRPGHPDHDHQLDAQSQPTPFSACIGLLPTLARTPSVCEQHPRRAPALPSTGQGSRSPDGDLRPTRRLHSAVSTRSRIDQDQGAPNPVGSPASRRGTGASIAHERVLSQIALPLALPFALPGPALEPRR